MEQWMCGRALLIEEIPPDKRPALFSGVEAGTIRTHPGFTDVSAHLSCFRCGSFDSKDHAVGGCACGKECVYCVRCLQMGKVTQCSVFYEGLEFKKEAPEVSGPLLAWDGVLSSQQQEASNDVVCAVKENRAHLIWAVAGAGKTEMMFEGIHVALQAGKRVCVSCPRVDVCLELAPRLKQAFPTVPLAVLHGSMDEPYRYTPLVIATTHQLWRFKEAFDVLVIDEVDAFPYHLDESLRFGAQTACKSVASLIYLSATPDKQLQQEVRTKRLQASILPARYHGYPLPVPTCKWVGNWKRQSTSRLPYSPVIRLMKKWVAMDRTFLVFIPNIEWMSRFEQTVRNHFPAVAFSSVSSKDPMRKEKVQAMRDHEYRFLLTTTILERGVTFPNVHVLVLGAEDRTFTEAALVQISGRAGRSSLYPTGDVVFLHFGQTRAMKQAIRQIRHMNRLGRKKGYVTHG